MNKNVKIATSGGIVFLQPDGIMRMEISKTDEITLENVNDFIAAVKEIGGGKPFCNLIIFEKFVQVDKESREYSASEEANIYTIAEAFVIKSAALKIVGNFYIQVNKPTRPTKIFTNEEDATKWLKTFL